MSTKTKDQIITELQELLVKSNNDFYNVTQQLMIEKNEVIRLKLELAISEIN